MHTEMNDIQCILHLVPINKQVNGISRMRFPYILRLIAWNAGAQTQSQVCPFEAVDWNIGSHILHKGIDNAFESCKALNLSTCNPESTCVTSHTSMSL